MREGALVLADGSVFEGELIGAERAMSSGEVVFNTVLSGYQEVLTDPSYAGQIVTFTNPHIGNYGVNPADDESRAMFCRGVVVRELARRHSNQRAVGDLDAYLRHHGLAGIAGIDTRRLTRILRDAGAMPGAFGSAQEAELRAVAAAEPGTDGIDLVAEVTIDVPYSVAARDGDTTTRVVAVDFGMKRNIVNQLAQIAHVEVVPATTTADEILARAPHGVFLSNGPGDPVMAAGATETIAALVGRVPLFGICLGHQLLGRALGGATVKLPFGHHGGNHPVKHLASGRIEITSQNHSYAVDADSLAGRATMTHVNLNDGVCEGLAVTGELAFSVQYHPEANPGPHDAHYLFGEFADMMRRAAPRASR